MFDSTGFTSTTPPPCAMRCLVAAAAEEHARATLLRKRSSGVNSRNRKARGGRLSVASLRAEALSRDINAEVR